MSILHATSRLQEARVLSEAGEEEQAISLLETILEQEPNNMAARELLGDLYYARQFQCLHCGHADRADRVAAANLKARLFDSEITLWTPKERVKEILLSRFYARLERGGNPVTVSGRTPAQSLARRAKRPMQSRSARENVGAKSG